MTDTKETIKQVEERRRTERLKQIEEEKEDKRRRRAYLLSEKDRERRWKEIGWEKQPRERFEYAVWYYHKRFLYYNVSWALLAIIFLKSLIIPHSVSYFIFAFSMGVARAITADGEMTFLPGRGIEYGFFEKSFKDRLTQRFVGFLFALILAPVALLCHIYGYIYVILSLKMPPPPYVDVKSDDSDPGERIVGRIDEDGYIWKSDD